MPLRVLSSCLEQGACHLVPRRYLSKGCKVYIALAREPFGVIQGYVVPALQRHCSLQDCLALQRLPEPSHAPCTWM